MNYTEDEMKKMSPEEKKKALFFSQKAMLDSFLEKKAITQSQYDKSFGDLKKLMGFEDI